MANKCSWIFTEEEIKKTPSRLCGLTREEEHNLRYQAAFLIQEIGEKLNVSQLCINTAIVYMHRFYMKQSFKKFHLNTMSSACLFLAAKVEEQSRKIEFVAKVLYSFNHKQQKPSEHSTQEIQSLMEEIVCEEQILLQTLGFQTIVEHPHSFIVNTCSMVRATKEISHSSYMFATNSLVVTMMCVRHPPPVIACVCINIACRWGGFEIPKSSEGKTWFHYVDVSMTTQKLEELTNELAASIDKYPTKNSRKNKSLASRTSGSSYGNQTKQRPPHSQNPSSHVPIATISSNSNPNNQDNHSTSGNKIPVNKLLPGQSGSNIKTPLTSHKRPEKVHSLTPQEYKERRERVGKPPTTQPLPIDPFNKLPTTVPSLPPTLSSSNTSSTFSPNISLNSSQSKLDPLRCKSSHFASKPIPSHNKQLLKPATQERPHQLQKSDFRNNQLTINPDNVKIVNQILQDFNNSSSSSNSSFNKSISNGNKPNNSSLNQNAKTLLSSSASTSVTTATLRQSDSSLKSYIDNKHKHRHHHHHHHNNHHHSKSKSVEKQQMSRTLNSSLPLHLQSTNQGSSISNHKQDNIYKQEKKELFSNNLHVSSSSSNSTSSFSSKPFPPHFPSSSSSAPPPPSNPPLILKISNSLSNIIQPPTSLSTLPSLSSSSHSSMSTPDLKNKLKESHKNEILLNNSSSTSSTTRVTIDNEENKKEPIKLKLNLKAVNKKPESRVSLVLTKDKDGHYVQRQPHQQGSSLSNQHNPHETSQIYNSSQFKSLESNEDEKSRKRKLNDPHFNNNFKKNPRNSFHSLPSNNSLPYPPLPPLSSNFNSSNPPQPPPLPPSLPPLPPLPPPS